MTTMYPAGYSSEEDDFDEFGFENPSPRKVVFEKRILTPDEKLIDAVLDNDLDAAKSALEEGANIHCRSHYSTNHTPIMKAASSGRYEIMEFLIDRGANVNDDHEMFNVIMCLCNSSLHDETVLLKCLNLLLDKGADPLATDWVGATSLMNAIRRHRRLLAERLIESGCSVNAVDGEGWTPLFYSVQSGSVSMTKFLIEKGGDINKLNRFGLSLVEHAAPKNDKELSDLVTPEDMKEPEVSIDLQKQTHLSHFKEIMSTSPKKNDSLYGYHDDAINFLRGIGMEVLIPDMEKLPLQFAQLLTWNEQQWNQAGVQLSYHLRKISYSVAKYHEKEWSKGSFPDPAKIISKEDAAVDAFAVVQFLMNWLRNAHISSASVLYLLENCHEPLTEETIRDIQKTLEATALIEKQIKILKRFVRKLDRPTLHPPDRIDPQRPTKRNKSLFAQFTCNVLIQCITQTLLCELVVLF